MKENGKLLSRKAGQVFHAQDFPAAMFMLKSGYVKRYQVTNAEQPVIELIYGPTHIFPLSQLYKKIFGMDMNQEDLVYVYQAMTDMEIWRVDDDVLMEALENNHDLYIDVFFEAGLRLKANIDRLASNAQKDEYKKVAHLLVCLADEFGKPVTHKGKPATKIDLPLDPKDVAEQLNISVQIADAVINSLSKDKYIIMNGTTILVPDTHFLKDVYL